MKFSRVVVYTFALILSVPSMVMAAHVPIPFPTPPSAFVK